MTLPSRRQVVASATSASLLAACDTLDAPKPGKRPNILWLVSEDNNPLIGAYGDRLARTPSIDRLARQGVLFRNVYSNAPVCAPTRFTILTGVHSQSCAPANHMRARANIAGVLSTYPELMRVAGYYCSNNAKTDYNCDVDPQAVWDDNSNAAHWRNAPADKPFMAVFNIGTTHESQVFKPTPGRVQPHEVRVPVYLPDTPGMRQDFASYYNLIEKMDGQVGARLAELEAAGLAEDTVIFYYSDNGGVLPRSKRYCYDEGLRCALVVRIPAKWAHLAPVAAGGVIEAPVSFVDLAPTVLTLAGAPIPATMQGQPFLGRGASSQGYAYGMRNRMDERYDFVRTVTDGRYRYIRNYMPFLPAVQNQAYAWQARGYQDWEELARSGKLTPVQRGAFEPRRYEEFYDLRSDPDEIDNRIDDTGMSGDIREMRDLLDRQMVEINDNGFIPEGSTTEGYRESRATGAYPLKQIMAIAERAARRDPENLHLLQDALQDANDVLRYWGAMGLLMQEAHAVLAKDALAATMRSDASRQVRIVAAEACARFGLEDESIAVLAALLDEAEITPVRLQALNALTRIGRGAVAAMPALRAAATGDSEYLSNAATYLVQVLEGTYDSHKPIFPL